MKTQPVDQYTLSLFLESREVASQHDESAFVFRIPDGTRGVLTPECGYDEIAGALDMGCEPIGFWFCDLLPEDGTQTTLARQSFQMRRGYLLNHDAVALMQQLCHDLREQAREGGVQFLSANVLRFPNEPLAA